MFEIKEIIDFGNGATLEIEKSGSRFYVFNGHYHREDGPAAEWANGDRIWWRHDKIHRTDGPAVELANGYKSWYINGEEYSEEEYNVIIQCPWII